MAATLDEDLAEGMKITEQQGEYTAVWVLHARDLEGANAMERLAAAPDLLTSDHDAVIVQGQVLPRQTMTIDPWPPADAILTLTFAKTKTQGGGLPGDTDDYGPALISGGTSTELTETDFDYDNLQLPFEDRVGITVAYEELSASTDSDSPKQDARVPRFAAKSTFTFSRVANTDPSARSRAYVSFTNATTFFGMAANTVLCTLYPFEQQLDGTYRESITFAWDPDGWVQYARYRLDDGSFPALTNAQIDAENGIKVVTVQGEAEFNDLDLVVYTP